MTTSKNTILLRGSTDTVADFFHAALSSILYQRGIYPPESFAPIKKYGLTIMAVKEDKLSDYLQAILKQFTDWLATSATLQKVVLVVTSATTKETLERWTFDIHTDKSIVTGEENEKEAAEQGQQAQQQQPKSDAQIMAEIQAIIRQITASVTFLPLLEDACTIDLLAYTDRDSDVPLEWEESDPKLIDNAANVKLRSFSTSVHNVETMVAYKNAE